MQPSHNGSVENDRFNSPLQAQVFIDNPAGYAIKNLYNEKTLEYLRSVNVAVAYPFPYGFFLNTTSGDGDNLDCFVITDRNIRQGEIVTVEPIGVMEVTENDKTDHKVIAQLAGEDAIVNDELKDHLTRFIYDVFSDRPNKHMLVGNFLGRTEAIQLLLSAQDSVDATIPSDTHYNEV